MEPKNKNEFLYDDEEAIEIIRDYLSDGLRKKLSKEDIGIILDLKFAYMEHVNIVGDSEKPRLCIYTAELNCDAMDEFVMSNALKKGICISEDELQEIWDGDDEYLFMNGQISDEIPPELN